MELVKYFVQSKNVDIHINNEKPFRFAAISGSLEIVKYLSELGANVHAENEGALREACGCGHLDIVKYLIRYHNCDMHAYDNEAIEWAALQDRWDVLKYLIDQTDSEKFSSETMCESYGAVLYYTCTSGNFEMVKYLIYKGISININNDFVLRKTR